MNWHIHKWSQWEQYEANIRTMPGILAPKNVQGKIFESVELRQRRHCEKCNKMQDQEVQRDY